MNTFYDPELDLLGDEPLEDESAGSMHAFRTAPIFTGDAFAVLGSSILPQRALYGRVIAQRAPSFPVKLTTPKLYINTNAPFSALVCGVQGSGKSHSTSVLLESCLMADSRLGTLPAPLSALVFHFDTAAGGGAVQPCEAAYLATLDTERGGGATPPAVIVLVLPANLQAMRRVYAGLSSVRVEPLHFSAEDISGERLLAMMKVDENTQMPLYMEAIMSILRTMESNFSYTLFREELNRQKFNPGQKSMLNLRLSLLDSCLKGGNMSNRVLTHFRKGQLTIIDLSSPFMDGSSACGFFDLILGLFIEADINAAGKLVVLDEAHKYLSDSQTGTSSRLTDSLLSVIRQQRHLATRVVISTQEPTVVPSKFLDLCSFIIAHRFSSPKWLRLLANHVSAAEDSFDELFAKIVSLRTGQAIMFAPNGLSVRGGVEHSAQSDSDSGVGASDDVGTVAPIGQGYLHVQSRLRVTRDGGHSILAVNDPASTTRLGRVPGMGPTSGGTDAGPRTGGSSALTGQTPVEAAAPPEPHYLSRSGVINFEGTTSTPALDVLGQAAPTSEHKSASIASATMTQTANSFPPSYSATTHNLSNVSHPVSSSSTENVLSSSAASRGFAAGSDKGRFRALIEYLQTKCPSVPEGKWPLRNVVKRFGRSVESEVKDAVNAGLLRSGKWSKREWVQLIPSFDYPAIFSTSRAARMPVDMNLADAGAVPDGTIIRPSGEVPELNGSVHQSEPVEIPSPESSWDPTVPTALDEAGPPSSDATTSAKMVVSLTGPDAKFRPLIQFLLRARAEGEHPVVLKQIRRHFDKERPEIYGVNLQSLLGDAIRRQIIQTVKLPDGKTPISLLSGVEYRVEPAAAGADSGQEEVVDLTGSAERLWPLVELLLYYLPCGSVEINLSTVRKRLTTGDQQRYQPQQFEQIIAEAMSRGVLQQSLGSPTKVSLCSPLHFSF